MRPWSPLKCLAVVSFGLLSACSLRPYYRQILPPDVSQAPPPGAPEKKQVPIRLIEPETGHPIPGGRVYLSTNRGRVGVTSDENGLLQMPVSPELLADNPLVEVVLPAGVRGYGFQPVKVEPPPPAPPPVAPPPPEGEPTPVAPPVAGPRG
jgi:hypothetical protein